MFLDSVLLILQEILEAALLLSVLLAVNLQLGAQVSEARQLGGLWYAAAICCGILGAAAFAWAMPTITGWFNDVGQEVTNAGMHFVIIACLYVHCRLLRKKADSERMRSLGAGLTLITVIALAITREGSEIFLYLRGISGGPSGVTSAVLGAGVACGIGVSTGILLYFGLLSLSRRAALRVGLALLSLFAGNMAAQAVQLLIQADWIPYSAPLWDTSGVLQEYTITGQLLYALVGYEATPSLIQVSSYLGAMLLIASTPLFRQHWWSGKISA
jgi:high-affinity iron transporter